MMRWSIYIETEDRKTQKGFKIEVEFIQFIYSDLQRDYEELIRQLRLKQARFDYLSSFFENTKQKIEAAKKMIEEQDKKISDSENRSQKSSLV